MSYPLLQVYDEATATVLWDFNDETGANNIESGSLRTWLLDDGFDLGSPDVQLTYSEPPETPGGALLHSRHGFAAMSLRCSTRGTSVDNLRRGVGALQRLLAGGGVLRWQPDSASEVRYIDFLAAADVPQLWRGQGEEVITVFNSFADMNGLVISLVRQPYLRGAKLAFGSNTLLNSTLLTDATGDSLPDGWTEVSTPTSESINAATESHQFTALTVGEKGWSQVVTTGVAVGDVFTGSVEGRVVSGATGEWLVRLEALSAADAVVGTYDSANQTGTSFTRVSVTTAALPATTTKVKLYFLADNSGAGTCVFQFRRAQLEEAAAATPFHVGTETVLNDPAGINGRVYPVYVSGDAPAPVTLDAKPAAETMMSLLTAVLSSEGVTGKGSLSEYMNSRKVYQMEGAVLYTDASIVADAAASGAGSNTLNVSYATPSATLRAEVIITTLMDSLIGKTFDVYARMSHTVATTTSTITMSTYYGETITNVPAVESDTVTFASSSTMANIYKDVKLGTVSFPYPSATGIVMRLVTARTLGTGALRLDSLFLVPVDEAVNLATTESAAYVISVGDSIRSDLGTGFIERLNSSGVMKRVGLKSKGPQPVVLRPGLNLLYVADWGVNASVDKDVSTLGASLTMKAEYAPRYWH